MTCIQRKIPITFPNIPERSTIMIEEFMIKSHPYRFASKCLFRKIRGFFAKFFHFLASMNCFGSINSQKSDTSLFIMKYNINSISVYHRYYRDLYWWSIKHLSTQNITTRNIEIPRKSINQEITTMHLKFIM